MPSRIFLLHLLILSKPLMIQSNSSYTPVKITWTIYDGYTSPIASVSETHLPWTWWPTIQVDAKRLFHRSDSASFINYQGFFSCPGHTQDHRCGGQSVFFCASWDCVSNNDGGWKWTSPKTKDLIKIQWGRHIPFGHYKGPTNQDPCSPHCGKLNVSFTNEGRQDRRWLTGLQWGIHLYFAGYPGAIMQVKVSHEPIQLQSIGPNPVLKHHHIY